ncbi:alpha/beta-hydrolase [Tilletiaria anomala UBC 951]|uniref:Alpha/beta-hydrolase n=1 Tax=Tilletiaria anomala (strain ATCC 24038 / CBS 436.72 / UBC 951) TaxID=1037660 RepID=A0A066W7D9_TILAU|nr:alpha/beta-hydrolase [Tilletiaria anomala UBC 951]KDN47004.1 alpha/beta-hydrolase [Tilletiaria anomala UBC 951]
MSHTIRSTRGWRLPFLSLLLGATVTALTLTLTAAPADAQFVPPPAASSFTHATGHAAVPVKYRSVPTGPGEVCEQTPGVKSYAGYAEVEKGEFIFWWFFEARKTDPRKAELTSWINGGPGSSSMIGLFQELGPCGVDSEGKVTHNPYAWNEHSNLLIIDQPISTGFSYSQPSNGYVSSSGHIVNLGPSSDTSIECPSYVTDAGLQCGTFSSSSVRSTVNSTQAAAPNFWKTLQGFMGAFPQYSRKGFHFATESYGGHYGPVFNEYIENQNAKIANGELSDAKQIQLQTVILGNPWVNPKTQYEAYYEYAIDNYYDIHPYNASIRAQVHNNLYGPGNCVDQLDDCASSGIDSVCSTADTFCATEVEEFLDIISGRDEYDMRELQPDPFPPTFYVDYLNSPKVQEAIGAYTNFSESSITVGNTFSTTGDDAREEGTVQDIRKLLDKGIYVVIQVGDADYNCNIHGNLRVAEQIAAPGYSSAGFTNISTTTSHDDAVHGQVRQSSAFAFIRWYYSGHEVPFYQPRPSLQVFNRAIRGLDVATGKQRVVGEGSVKGYKTHGPKTSTFKEGSATVQNHVLPPDATYNTTTGAPNAYKGQAQSAAAAAKRKSSSRASSRHATTFSSSSSSRKQHGRSAAKSEHLRRGVALGARFGGSARKQQVLSP